MSKMLRGYVQPNSKRNGRANKEQDAPWISTVDEMDVRTKRVALEITRHYLSQSEGQSMADSSGTEICILGT